MDFYAFSYRGHTVWWGEVGWVEGLLAVCFLPKISPQCCCSWQQAAGSTFWCSSLTACPSPINFTYFTGRQRPLNITNERTFAHIKIKFPHKLPAQHFWWHFFTSLPPATPSFPATQLHQQTSSCCLCVNIIEAFIVRKCVGLYVCVLGVFVCLYLRR